MAVQVDIPGIGTVVAQNAAQDSTLQGILNTLQNQASGTVSTAGVQQLNAASGRASAGLTSVSRSSAAAGQSIEQAGVSASRAGSNFKQASKSVFASFGTLASQSTSASGSMKAFAEAATAVTKGAGNMIFQGLGTAAAAALGLITGVLSKNIEQYEKVQAAGATFGYSIEEFRKVAESAGMTVGELAAVVQKTAGALSSFGGTTVEGGRLFGKFNSDIREAEGGTLIRMGIGYQEQSERLAEFMGTLAASGENIENLGTEEVRNEFMRLTQQSKLMAQYNGITMEQSRQRIKAMEKDARVQAALGGLSGPQREAMKALMEQAEGAVAGSSQAIQEALLTGDFTKMGPLMQETGQFGIKLLESVKMIQAGNTDVTSTMAEGLAGLTPEIRDRVAEMAKIGVLTGSAIMQPFVDANRDIMVAAGKNVNEVLEKLVKEKEKLGDAADATTTAMIRVNEAGLTFATKIDEILNAFMRSNLFQSALDSINTGIAGLTQGVNQVSSQTVDQLQASIADQAVAAATQQIVDMGAGVASALKDGFAKFFGFGDDADKRALGGPVFPGQRYLVGERGPELLELNQAGMITPNYKLNDIGSLPDMTGFSQALQQSIEEIRDVGAMTATSEATKNVIDDETKDAILQLPMLLTEVNSQQERMIRSVDESSRMIAHAVS